MTAASANMEVTSGKYLSSKSEENIGRLKNQTMQRNGLEGTHFGGKYSVVNPNRKLGFAYQITRQNRENVMSPSSMATKPPVGLYHPQDRIITKRPKTHEFSRIGKFNTAGQQKPLPEPVTVPRAFEDQLRRIKNEKLTNMKRQLMLQHEATINSEGIESPTKNGNSQLKNSQRSQKLSMNDISTMYRTQRFCNTVKVYKKFCKQANMPANWSIRNSFDNNCKLGDDQNPVKQKVQTVNFSK
jgi:hypothetical protein